MAYLDALTAAEQQLLDHRLASSVVIASLLAGIAFLVWPADPNQVPKLSEPIPYVSNTYLYLVDMRKFLHRATQALRRKKIAWFRLGPMKVYLTTGPQNVQAMFRTSPSISSDKFVILMMDTIWGLTKEDVSKFVGDKSGRLKTPAVGTEKTPQDQRYWANMHRTLHDYLAQTDEANKLAATYKRLFAQRLEKYPAGQWSTISIFAFLRTEMAEAAITSLAGPRLLEMNPGFVDLFWHFDEIAGSLAWGIPKWMNREAWDTHARIGAACTQYVETGLAGNDVHGPDSDLDWEPNLGSRVMRGLVEWMRDSDFSPRSMGGTIAALGIFAQNSNTIPVTTWALIELVKDPELFQAIREEVITTYVTDPATQERIIDTQKLVSLPLLQSVYSEALRLHVSVNITREIIEPIELEGYKLEKGALLQAPSEIALCDESVWSTKGHPALEFWAERHIKYVEVTDETGKVKRERQFVLAGRANEFFPYGGGVSMCPGRFFAKQEIMLTLGMLVSNFDIEFVQWRNLDGSPSTRAAENDSKWAGAAAMPPDRDMEVRWRRRA
ncbi:cytochrome P450 [Xylariales sp. PMI_506]|nr:cytochrome P450 [Xylariales sp. PMI_506]